MRTTLNIPEGVLEEAQRVTRFTSKTDVVTLALRELVRRSHLDELIAAAGTFDAGELVEVDRSKARRRVAGAGKLPQPVRPRSKHARRRP